MGSTYMTVFIPDSCWNIWRPQPTIRALRVGPWRRIRKITKRPKEKNSQKIPLMYLHFFNVWLSMSLCTKGSFVPYRQAHFVKAFIFFLFSQKYFTSTSLFLLFLNDGFDGVVLLVNVLAPSNPAESLAGLLVPALLEKPTRALRQEEEADELQHCWENGQTQHVPTVWREREGVKGWKIPMWDATRDICHRWFSRWGLKTLRGLGGHYRESISSSIIIVQI